MRGVLRRVGALHRGDAAFVRAATRHPLAMLQDVDALDQRIEEEAGGSIAHFLIIAGACAKAVARQRIDRLQTSGALVLQLHEVHGAIQTERDARHEDVSHSQSHAVRQRLQRLASVRGDALHVELFVHRQFSAVLLQVGHRREELGVDGSPGSTLVALLHGDSRSADSGTVVGVGLAHVAQAGDSRIIRQRLDGDFLAQRDAHVALVGQPIPATCQQRIDGICSSDRRIPRSRLLLLQQPEFHFFQQRVVASHQSQGFHRGNMRGDRHHTPTVSVVEEGEVSAHFILLNEMLAQGSGEVSGLCGLACLVQDDQCLRLARDAAVRQFILHLGEVIVVGFARTGRHFLAGQSQQIEVIQLEVREAIHLHARRLTQPRQVILPNLAVQVVEGAVAHRSGLRIERFARQQRQANKEGEDVLRDVAIAPHTGIPTPRTVAVLHLAQLVQGRSQAEGHRVDIEQRGETGHLLALVLRFGQPRRFFQQDILHVRILLQAAQESFFRAALRFPRLQHRFDARMGRSDVSGQAVGIPRHGA